MDCSRPCLKTVCFFFFLMMVFREGSFIALGERVARLTCLSRMRPGDFIDVRWVSLGKKCLGVPRGSCLLTCMVPGQLT